MTNKILVDVNRCTGCWTCSMSCKMQYDLAPDEFRQYVRTIGGGEIDQPGGKWPHLYLKWMPIWKLSCIECKGDSATDNIPYCVFNCPTSALTYGDADDSESDFSKRKTTLLENGYRVYEISKWEDTKEFVEYAENSV